MDTDIYIVKKSIDINQNFYLNQSDSFVIKYFYFI